MSMSSIYGHRWGTFGPPGVAELTPIISGYWSCLLRLIDVVQEHLEGKQFPASDMRDRNPRSHTPVYLNILEVLCSELHTSQEIWGWTGTLCVDQNCEKLYTIKFVRNGNRMCLNWILPQILQFGSSGMISGSKLGVKGFSCIPEECLRISPGGNWMGKTKITIVLFSYLRNRAMVSITLFHHFITLSAN